jgi:O-antigen/teichoic acid export membrane protein
MLRRIVLGFGANAFGQLVNIVIQLFSLPLFLLYWDTATYGTWLMISAAPSYVSMADVGMVQAASNNMTMAMGRSDVVEANRIFQSAQLFMIGVCASLAVVVTPLLLWGPMPDFITANERIALAALFFDVLFAMFAGLSEAVFKATGRFGLGLMLLNLTRLAEWGGFMLGLFLFRTFAGVAIVGLLARLTGIACNMYVAQRGEYGLNWGISQATKAEIMVTMRPAVSFMAFPLANALSFSGVTLLVGALLGPAAVAIVNTYRTISRIAVQLTGMFSLALWPEFGRLFGQGGPKAVESLFRKSAWLGVAQSVGLSFVLYFISPWLLNLWTHGRIEFFPVLMMWMLAYATIGGVWHVPRVLLLSTNQHVDLAGWSIAAGVLAVLLTWLFATAMHVNGVGVAMLISEAFIAAICIYLAHRTFVDA